MGPAWPGLACAPKMDVSPAWHSASGSGTMISLVARHTPRGIDRDSPQVVPSRRADLALLVTRLRAQKKVSLTREIHVGHARAIRSLVPVRVSARFDAASWLKKTARMLAEVRVARCEAHPSSFQGIAHRCNHRRMSRENHRSRPRPQPHTCTSHVLTGGLWNSGARRAIASPPPSDIANMLANANLDNGPVGVPAPFAASARTGAVRSLHWTRPCRDSRLAHRPIAHRPSPIAHRPIARVRSCVAHDPMREGSLLTRRHPFPGRATCGLVRQAAGHRGFTLSGRIRIAPASSLGP